MKTYMKELQKSLRVGAACRLFFFGENDFEGEAQVLDLSVTGCRVKSGISLEMGMRLKLSIFLPDQHPWPVRVEEAAVRWCQDPTFGLEFLSIRPPQLQRVRHFVTKSK